MASAVVGILRVLLSANTAEYTAAMKSAADSAKLWSKDLKSIGAQATEVGAALTKSLTLPIAGIAGASLKAAADFQTAFAGVRKTVDATEPELAVMEQQFRDLALAIPLSVNELARLGEIAGALNIPKEAVVDFARVMAELGVTTDLTADAAAQSIGEIQTVFQTAGKETNNFASALVELGNNGASVESKILELANRIASAGKAVGMRSRTLASRLRPAARRSLEPSPKSAWPLAKEAKISINLPRSRASPPSNSQRSSERMRQLQSRCLSKALGRRTRKARILISS
jgi:hypothetical protein